MLMNIVQTKCILNTIFCTIMKVARLGKVTTTVVSRASAHSRVSTHVPHFKDYSYVAASIQINAWKLLIISSK